MNRLMLYIAAAPRVSMMIDRVMIHVVNDRLNGVFPTWAESFRFNFGVLRGALSSILGVIK